MKILKVLYAPISFGLNNLRYHLEQTALLSLLMTGLFLVSFFSPFLFLIMFPVYLVWGFMLVRFGAVEGTGTRDAIDYKGKVSSLKLKKPISDLRLHVFQTGEIKSGSWGLYEGSSKPIVLDQAAFLIEHPKHGFVMFEAGINPKVSTNPVSYIGAFLYYGGFLKMQQKPHKDSYSQLKRNGFDPKKIKTIYISHLHPEHCGAIEMFTDSAIAVDKREYEYAMGEAKYNYFKKEYKDIKKWDLISFDKHPKFLPFEGFIDIFGDNSVLVISTPGHTPGSMSMLLNLPGGAVFLVGDIAWRMENISTKTIGMPFVSVESIAHREALGKLIAFMKKNSNVTIVPTHDIRNLINKKRDDILVFE